MIIFPTGNMTWGSCSGTDTMTTNTAKAPKILKSVAGLSASLLYIMLMACATVPGCYRLEDEALRGRAPSIFYVEAFEKNVALYQVCNCEITNFEKYEKMEPSYTHAAGSEIYFLLFMDDDLLHGYFSFDKPTVNRLKKEVDTYVLEETINPLFAPIGIQQLWGTDYFTVPVLASTGDTYKYIFTVPDTDGNVSEPAEVLITVE